MTAAVQVGPSSVLLEAGLPTAWDRGCYRLQGSQVWKRYGLQLILIKTIAEKRRTFVDGRYQEASKVWDCNPRCGSSVLNCK